MGSWPKYFLFGPAWASEVLSKVGDSTLGFFRIPAGAMLARTCRSTAEDRQVARVIRHHHPNFPSVSRSVHDAVKSQREGAAHQHRWLISTSLEPEETEAPCLI